MGLGELDKYATFNGPEIDTGRSRLDRVRLQVETEKKPSFIASGEEASRHAQSAMTVQKGQERQVQSAGRGAR